MKADSGKPLLSVDFRLMVYKKRNWKKRWQALQVNLGHFIKNRCHNKGDWKRRVWAAGTCWVTMVRVFFWYYSCYCKYYASSAFQHRENISACAHETVFLFSVLYRHSGLLKKGAKEKICLTGRWKKKEKKNCLPALLHEFTWKDLNVIFEETRWCSCIERWQDARRHVSVSLTGNKRSIFCCVSVVEGKREKEEEEELRWESAAYLLISTSE